MSGTAKIIAAILAAITSIGLAIFTLKRERKKNLQEGIEYLKSSYYSKLNTNYDEATSYSLLPYPSLLKYLSKKGKQQITIENRLNKAYANKAEAQEALTYVHDIIKDFDPNQ